MENQTRKGFAIFDKNNRVRLDCLGETEDDTIARFVERIRYNTLEIFMTWEQLQAEPHGFSCLPVTTMIFPEPTTPEKER